MHFRKHFMNTNFGASLIFRFCSEIVSKSMKASHNLNREIYEKTTIGEIPLQHHAS